MVYAFTHKTTAPLSFFGWLSNSILTLFAAVVFIFVHFSNLLIYSMKLVRRMIAAVMVAAVCLATLATTAFAAGKNLVGLSDDEIFDLLWERIDYGSKGLEASLMYDYCKQFVYKEFDMQGKESNYDSDDIYHDFLKWYENQTGGMIINLYDKEVADYLKEHPGADLRWTDGAGAGAGELKVYDSNVLLATVKDSKSRDELSYMQYSSESTPNIVIWSYDSDKEQFIGNDEDGKLVKKVTAYSKPYGYRETSNTSKQEESSKATASKVETTSSDQKSKQEEMVVAESKVNSVATESSTKTSAVEESLAEEESNDNSTTIIIIICGVIIAGVFAFLIIRPFLIIRQKKKKV